MLQFIKKLFTETPQAKCQKKKLTQYEIRVLMARRKALKALQK